MKIIHLSVLVVLLSFSCSKKNTVVSPNQVSESPPVTPSTPSNTFANREMGDNLTYLLNGTLTIEPEEITETDSTQYVVLDSTILNIFSGETKMLAWAVDTSADNATTRLTKGNMRGIILQFRTFHNAAAATPGILDNNFRMDSLFRVLYPGKLNDGDAGGGNVGKVRGFVGACYKNTNYSNGYLPVCVYWSMPSGWNNVISSWWGLGFVLCDYTWWNGARLWWWSPGGWNGTSPYNYYNDRTSSMFIL